jgi:hypothetical protein
MGHLLCKRLSTEPEYHVVEVAEVAEVAKVAKVDLETALVFSLLQKECRKHEMHRHGVYPPSGRT